MYLSLKHMYTLYDILTHPQEGVKVRYLRLVVSDKKGWQVKEGLLRLTK